jgi:SNF2 family DNA or RNA helicase
MVQLFLQTKLVWEKLSPQVFSKRMHLKRSCKKRAYSSSPSLVNQWVSELKEKFELDFKIVEKESDWTDYGFMIASMDRVKLFDKKNGKFKHEKAHQINWDIIIVDEAHKLKEKNTIRWIFVDRLKKKRFLLLTATPFQNDLIELYNLLNLLKKGHLRNNKRI